MSMGFAEHLLERSKRYLESALDNLRENRFDVAVVEAEIGAQLALKALIARLGFEPPRTHAIRRLLSFIVDNELLPSRSLEELREFAKMSRERLIILERARMIGQYGTAAVDRAEAEVTVEIAREVLGLAEKYWQMDL